MLYDSCSCSPGREGSKDTITPILPRARCNAERGQVISAESLEGTVPQSCSPPTQEFYPLILWFCPTSLLRQISSSISHSNFSGPLWWHVLLVYNFYFKSLYGGPAMWRITFLAMREVRSWGTEGREKRFKRKLVSCPTRTSQSSRAGGGGWRGSRQYTITHGHGQGPHPELYFRLWETAFKFKAWLMAEIIPRFETNITEAFFS